MAERIRVIGTTGDASPLEFGGGVVYVREKSRSARSAQRAFPFLDPDPIGWTFWHAPEDDDIPVAKAVYDVYNVDLPDDVVAAQLLQKWGRSEDWEERLRVLEDLAWYHSPENLDSYPNQVTGAELRRQWRKHVLWQRVDLDSKFRWLELRVKRHSFARPRLTAGRSNRTA